MTSQFHRNGFTLLEVMVALVVIAIAMTAAFQVVSSSSRTLRKLQDGTYARWIAESEMANIQLGLATLAIGEESGEAHMAKRIWHWQRQITVAADPAMRRVLIAVSAKNTNEVSATLIAYMPAEDKN